VPPATRFPSGCRFHPRCPIATERCRQEEPLLLPLAGAQTGRTLACHHREEAAAL
ncbi:MAG: oligopeptide ABC transporter ATP-binding protein, partial [Planctomycetota bacterium]|jgi:oligopeptide/dipeptide ABC transporter ATP-binding protein|nr:oligopeptide ABC transporter ATP-binding protein [Planctomycetota bacterium]